MNFFELPDDESLRPYAERLQYLMANWENELVEFKAAKTAYDTDKIGRYFSALSNEANLRRQQCGWLIFGVSEEKGKHLVGTHFKDGPKSLLEKFKGEISKSTNGLKTFDEIIELNLKSEGKTFRVLMFRVPAAATGIPTEWCGRPYGRAGEDLVILQQEKIDRIRSEERYDWSKQVIANSNISCLDVLAVQHAREKFKERVTEDNARDEIDHLSDEEFLTKIRLMVDGRLTNAALLLLGNAAYDNLFATPPKMMWRLYGADGSVRDYEIFEIPFILAIDKMLGKIRNLTYRYIPNQMTLFPQEIQQYDTWLLRELLNNCIAHSNYRLGGRIYLNEFEEEISITNPGQFLPQSVENVLQPSYNPPFYLNQLLADAMVKFHMIDTSTMGIRKVFRIQRERYFPLPDYDLDVYQQVGVKVYGKILNDAYMHILYDRPELELKTVFLLDQVQKGRGRSLTGKQISELRKLRLVEGKKSALYVSASVARSTEREAEYIRNRAFDDQYYCDMIVEYLKKYSQATKIQIRGLLLDKLPDSLTDNQREYKIGNLLSSLKKRNIIHVIGREGRQFIWALTDQ